MANSLFSQIPVSKPKRNFFDLSHDVKLTLDMGYLVPTVWIECYPGDSISVGCSMQLRFAPLIAPVMHQINWYVHYFFVPYRVLWPNWELYYQSPTDMSGGEPPVFPFITVNAGNYTGRGGNSVFDYMGVPLPGSGNDVYVNAMPFAAYNKIYEDYYMDENNHHNIPDWELVDGINPAVVDSYWPFRRAWEKDYFTSALPWAQKGPQVNIPVGTLEDVRVFRNATGVVTGLTNTAGLTTTLYSAVSDDVSTTPGQGGNELYAATGGMEIEATSINDWRRALKLQEFLERMARGGSRPTEITRSVFGVTPPDYRLQRAEYITGARGQVIVSEVLATAGTFNTSDVPLSAPVGDMAGHAIGVGSGYPGKYFCSEHGVLMGILSVMPKPAYKDGVHANMLAKGDALDGLAWPQFGNLGEQPIKNVELYSNIPTALHDDTFGYTPRYAQHKYMPNRVAGDFRDNLAYWTLVRDFTDNGLTPVPLDFSFIECNPTKDIFAVTEPNVNSLYAHIWHSIKTKRCFPKFGVPSI